MVSPFLRSTFAGLISFFLLTVMGGWVKFEKGLHAGNHNLRGFKGNDQTGLVLKDLHVWEDGMIVQQGRTSPRTHPSAGPVRPAQVTGSSSTSCL